MRIIINENKDKKIDTKTSSTTDKNVNQNTQKLQSKNNQENTFKENNEPQTFTALNTSIQSNLSNHEITLEYDYTYTSADGDDLKKGITIDGDEFTDGDKTFTINGNGHTINGSNSARIFTITNQAHLILKNITLTKGNTKTIINDESTNMGGVLYINNAQLTIIKCNFTKNNAIYGGAIYSYKSNLTITNSNFTDNNATA